MDEQPTSDPVCSLPVLRSRQGEPLALHVQEHPTGAPESVEESQHAAIGIHGQSSLRGPHVPDGQRQAPLSPTRLGHGRIEHPTAERSQLEFTHRALEPEQQPVVR